MPREWSSPMEINGLQHSADAIALERDVTLLHLYQKQFSRLIQTIKSTNPDRIFFLERSARTAGWMVQGFYTYANPDMLPRCGYISVCRKKEPADHAIEQFMRREQLLQGHTILLVDEYSEKSPGTRFVDTACGLLNQAYLRVQFLPTVLIDGTEHAKWQPLFLWLSDEERCALYGIHKAEPDSLTARPYPVPTQAAGICAKYTQGWFDFGAKTAQGLI